MGKSSLDEVAHAVAANQGRTVKPDPMPDRGSFYRSDHFAFARIGVPALSVDGGIDFIGKPAGLGQGADRGLRGEDAITSRAMSSTTAGTSTA